MPKKFNRLTEEVNGLIKNEGLGPETRDKIAKALKRLSHSLDVKNIKEAKKAAEELSKLLLRYSNP